MHSGEDAILEGALEVGPLASLSSSLKRKLHYPRYAIIASREVSVASVEMEEKEEKEEREA